MADAVHPQLRVFLKDWDEAWSTLPAGSGPAQRRAHFEKVAAAMREPDPVGIVTREHWIPVPQSGQSVRLREFRLADASGPLPALVYMHGGGWMQGSPETHWDIAAGIAARCRQAVFSVDYALAPERPFPQAVNDCSAVVRWVFAQAQALAVNPNAIAVGGDSAGANLAASQTQIHRGSAQKLRAQLLIYPAVDFALNRPSHVENADGPLLRVAAMPATNAMYCPNPADLQNPLAAPLLAATLQGLPPAYVAVAQCDPLRDEGIAYAERLQASAYCDDARASFERMCDWLALANA
jgi:acetyl esterase